MALWVKSRGPEHDSFTSQSRKRVATVFDALQQAMNRKSRHATIIADCSN
jgi:hypothetical protein